MVSLSSFSNLVDLLRWRASTCPQRLACIFLADGETEEVSLTYGKLDLQARSIAARLHSLGAKGERALLLYPAGLEYIAAFFGCLYAGVIAVPAYPPRPNRSFQRLEAIVADAETSIALTTTTTISRIANFLAGAGHKGIRWLTTDDWDCDLSSEWREHLLTGETLAFLQYTSGSTASPKGVMVSHSNLLHNQRLIQVACGHTEQSVFVSWLPIYHDMGLIGNIIQPLYMGATCVLMPPASFLQKPARWLQAISRYKAHTSGGPNFAYDLCVRKITPAQVEALDLSSWRIAFNGAEPIRSDTIQRFTASFESCGFCPEAIYPCYGLAEATLFVSGGTKTSRPILQAVDQQLLERNCVATSGREGSLRELVSSGRAWLDQKIMIVDPTTSLPSPPDRVGEIWVASPSVAQGYWNRPTESARVFNAYLADSSDGPYLRTGDLGFKIDGELYVTARLKDLIIIHGYNYYPQDIERTAEQSHRALRPGGGASFSIERNGEEKLVILHEVEPHEREPDVEAIAGAIRRAVSEEHQLQVYVVALLKAGSLPKTSSGKTQRYLCRSGYLERDFEFIGKSVIEQIDAGHLLPSQSNPVVDALLNAPPEESLAWLRFYLRQQASQVMKIELSRLNSELPLIELGLDSLMAAELKSKVEDDLGIVVPLSDFFRGRSVAQLAFQALDYLNSTGASRTGLTDSVDKGRTESPLSHGQRAIWFLHGLASDSAVYNLASAVRIRQDIDIDTLRRAFQDLVDRHACLRTTFSYRDGEPIQIAHENQDICFEVVDSSAYSEALLNERLSEEANCRFDLEQGPLLRVKLYTHSTRGHVLLLVIHHIAADLWSMALLIQELGEFYSAEKSGVEANLPPLTLQYADYIRWETQMLAGPDSERLWAYWRKRLENSQPSLNLPIDRPRPPVQTFRGKARQFKVNAQLGWRLKTLGQACESTLFMTLLAAFQALLYRYTHQNEVFVGSPTNGRNRREWAPIIGYFVNPLVLRADLSGSLPFDKFLVQTRETALSAFEHQDYPFALLVERLQPERDVGQSPLFQVMFIFQRSPFGQRNLSLLAMGAEGVKLEVQELTLESMALPERTSRFDLTLMMAEADDGLAASWQYNTCLFDESTIIRLTAHFKELLESIARNPGNRLSDLQLLTAAERHQLLWEWSDTRQVQLNDITLLRLFDAQVERAPDGIAVVYKHEHLTYQELDCRAKKLGAYLESLGVGVESLVGVNLRHSPEMLVALLGVNKAGAAYVPLDPAYPRERLLFMVEDSKLHVILAETHLAGGWVGCRAEVICVSDIWNTAETKTSVQVSSWRQPGNLAYVIYTSGSTGTPKGVAVTNESLVNILAAMSSRPGLGAYDTLLAVTSLSFDIAALELFLPLTIGAKLVLFGHELAIDGDRLASEIKERMATVIQATPSTWRMLSNSWVNVPWRVRALCGGEALPPELARRLLELGVEVWNLYGPTETTVWSTVEHVTDGNAPIRIGRGIDNTQVLVLDGDDGLVSIGVSGEIAISGEGVCRGYWRQPGLTADRFRPNSFSADPGRRLYRSGDLARYANDGKIEFLGRFDYQVKIRGYRIELSEVETALRQQSYVQDAVVVAGEGASGEVNLVAYVIPDQKSIRRSSGEEDHIARWRDVWNETYQTPSSGDPTFDLRGWNSAYTGLPIGESEMREWVVNTVRRVMSIRPKRVLEIGCGTGLLLFRVAPHCLEYCATDIAPGSLSHIQQQLAERRINGVTLLRQSADDFEGIKEQSFDTVIINSVAQYFPDAEYLLRVLQRAVDATRSGGVVFIGDVRNLALLPAFHASVEFERAPSLITCRQLKSRVSERIANEKELAVDPSFFILLKKLSPRISSIEILLKRGRRHNELTRFRYDVLVHVGSEKTHPTKARRLTWQGDLTCDVIRRMLNSGETESYILADTPNAQLAGALTLQSLLAGCGDSVAVGDLRERLAATRQEAEIGFEDLWMLGEGTPYTAEVRWAASANIGRCDVIFKRRDAAQGCAVVVPDEDRFAAPSFPIENLVSNPLRRFMTRDLTFQLKGCLREKLPQYMIPAAFVMLDRFPLTPNGKIDRRALPAPSVIMSGAGRAEFARTQVEDVLFGVWRDLLGVEHIAADDSFFDLGGHSLLAMQLVSRIRSLFSIEMGVRDVFEAPSIAGLARYVEMAISPPQNSAPPPLLPHQHEGDLPLSFAQERMWLIDQISPQNPAFNIPIAIGLKGGLNAAALTQGLNQIVRRHEVLRTRFDAASGRPFQCVEPWRPLTVPIADLRGMAHSERQSRMAELSSTEAHRCFDIALGPLLRMELLLLGERDWVLLLTMHHIVSDGWSIMVFIKELMTFYQSYTNGEPSRLPGLLIKYGDYAVWQRQWLLDEVLEPQLSYWKRQLANIPRFQLPTDYPTPEVRTFRGLTFSFTLSRVLTESLKALSQKEGVSLFMSMLAAFKILLHHYSGQRDIVVGTDFAGRSWLELEGLIGFFSNQLVLRSDLSGNPSFRDLLHRVRKVVLDAYAHQHLPFEKLVQALKPDRRSGHSRLFEAKLVFLNYLLAPIEFHDLDLTLITVERKVTQDDLTLFLSDSEHGMIGTILYSAELFKPSTIVDLAQRFKNLLAEIIVRPEARIGNYEMFTEAEKAELERKKIDKNRSNLEKLLSISPRSISLFQGDLVTIAPLKDEGSPPLVIKAAVDGVDLVDWATGNWELIESRLADHGVLLFRGFNAVFRETFDRLARALTSELSQAPRNSVRRSIDDNVYTSSPDPHDKRFPWNNESYFNLSWPMRILFYCLKPADQGDETQIVDNRRVVELIDPEILEQFMQKGIMYVRDYNGTFGPGWQTAFQTTNRAQVEELCRANCVDFEWGEDDRLRTRCIRPAVVKHPRTGARSWFNQAHRWCLSRLNLSVTSSLLLTDHATGLPHHCRFGDGTPIPDSAAAEICDAYRKTAIGLAWEEGDILLLDNILATHWQNPFREKRKFVVAMGQIAGYADIAVSADQF